MRFQHLTELIYFKPWLITPAAHESVRRVFAAHAWNDEPASPEKPAADPINSIIITRKPYSIDVDRICRIDVCGIIGHKISMIEKSCGNTDVEDLRLELNQAVKDRARGIILTINSPGGTTTGVPELADQIFKLKQDIPIVAFTDTQMCSAAYYISCAASTIIASESSQVGSIGVYIPWIDSKGEWDAKGLKADPIVNEGAVFKAAGFGPSLSEDQRNDLQHQVDLIAKGFKSFVEKNRMISDESMRGQMFMGCEALEFGLVDIQGNEDLANLTISELANDYLTDDDSESLDTIESYFDE